MVLKVKKFNHKTGDQFPPWHLIECDYVRVIINTLNFLCIVSLPQLRPGHEHILIEICLPEHTRHSPISLDLILY